MITRLAGVEDNTQGLSYGTKDEQLELLREARATHRRTPQTTMRHTPPAPRHAPSRAPRLLHATPARMAVAVRRC